MRRTAAVTALATLGIAIALVFRFRPESTVPPDSAAPPKAVVASGSAVDGRDDSPGAPPGQASPLAHTDSDAAAAAPATPTEARAPLPGDTPAAPMTQFLKDVQSNVIVGQTPGPPPIPAEMVEGERAFAVEPIDAAWAPSAEADLLAKFAQMQGLKLLDLRVECRSTMCRLEMSQPSAAPGERPPSFNSLVDSLGMKPRWVVGLIGPSGVGLKSFAYLWRDGFAPKPPTDQLNEAH